MAGILDVATLPMQSLLFCAVLFLAQAHAQSIVDTPVLAPTSPTSGQMVSVELHGNPCVLYLTPPDTPYDVVRDNSTITLTVQAVVSPDFDFCIYPTDTESYPIGSFTSGPYAVVVRAQYLDFFGRQITQTLGTLEFAVAAPERIPALSGWGLLLLVLLLGGIVWNRGNRWELSSS